MGSLQECSSRIRFMFGYFFWYLEMSLEKNNFMSFVWDWKLEKMTDLDLRGERGFPCDFVGWRGLR